MSPRAATTGTAPTPARPLGTWRSRIPASTAEDPASPLANPRNWRTHPAAQRRALRWPLDTVGWVQRAMVNRQTGLVVDGHARVALALSRGEPAVPALWVDLSPGEEALVLATPDPIAAMADAGGSTFALTARAEARGWGAAFGSGGQPVSIGWHGRGERGCPATTDLYITMRLAEPPEPCWWLQSA